MTGEPIDSGKLAALVDGELSAEEAALIEAQAAADPELDARLARARELRHAVAGAYEPGGADLIPERLLRAARGDGQVVDLARARSGRRWSLPRLTESLAIAASLAAAFAIGRLAQPPVAPFGPSPGGGLVARGPLALALQDQLAATQRPDAAVKIGVSFRSTAGEYCRTFALRTSRTAGLACRAPAGWRVEMAVDAPAASSSGYRLAGEETPAPVLEATDRMIAGAPLDAGGEARAKAAGWRAPKR